MRRRTPVPGVLAVVALVVTMSATGTASAGAASKAGPSTGKLRPGSIWMFGDGRTCEADSFASDGTFSGTSDDGIGTGGTYTRTPHGNKVTMTWTAGPPAGEVFHGTLHRQVRQYTGSYALPGTVGYVARLVPTAGRNGGSLVCPAASAAPASSSVSLGTSTTDSITVTGSKGAAPTGDVTFSVCPGDAVPCDVNGPTAVSLGIVALTGTGPIGSESASAVSPPFMAKAPGVYCFSAGYGGSASYMGVLESSTTDQCFTVTRINSLLTTAPASASIDLGAGITDTATLSTVSGFDPTGTVSFFVCGPLTSATGCTSAAGTQVGSPMAVTVTSNVTAVAQSEPFTAKSTGTYCFAGLYSGNTNYAPSSDGSADECFTVVQASAGPPIGILALNKVSPHEVLSGGTGEFVVAGDLFLNSAVTNQPWTGSAVDPTTNVAWEWDDAIDAKTNSNLYVYGTIHSYGGTFNSQPLWPLDTCFEPDIFGNGNPGTANPAYQAGDPATQLPSNQMQCNEYSGSVHLDYDAIDPTNAQINDPLSAAGAPPNPLSAGTDIACPGSSTQIDPPVTMANGVTQFTPGEYTTPVEITGSASFNDCPGGATGIYRFDEGLWINPQTTGNRVTGSNVVIGTEDPFPVAGNVPGTVTGTTFAATGPGNGAPCLPAGTLTGVPSGNGTPETETSANACGGTNPQTFGVIGYGDSTFAPDPNETGTGPNFSVIIGGVAGTNVTLTGPTSGVYGGTDGNPGLVLYQDPTVQANDGFDAESGDSADIAVNGVVYNASLTNYGVDSPLDYWDGHGGGIPFFAGGTLQTGFGAGWSAGPAESAGSVTLTGTAVVDDFNTDGTGNMTIISKPYSLPGTSSGALAPVRKVRSAAHGHRSSKRAAHRKNRHR